MSETPRPSPEEIIDTLIAEWPSGLSRPLAEVRRAIAELRRELAAARLALLRGDGKTPEIPDGEGLHAGEQSSP